jgi:6-phosphofructokinase 1
MGSLASDALLSGESGVMTALQGGELNLFPLEEAVAELKPLDTMLLELAEMMD